MTLRAECLLVACLLLAGCASVRPQADPFHAAYIGTAVTDVASTEYALSHGAVETNVLLPEDPPTAALIGMKVGGWLALRLLENWADPPWYGRILIWAPSIALQTYASIHNFQIGHD